MSKEEGVGPAREAAARAEELDSEGSEGPAALASRSRCSSIGILGLPEPLCGRPSLEVRDPQNFTMITPS